MLLLLALLLVASQRQSQVQSTNDMARGGAVGFVRRCSLLIHTQPHKPQAAILRHHDEDNANKLFHLFMPLPPH